MDKTPQSISSSCNNDDAVPEAARMEKVFSDLNALKKLYGLLQRLDETSRALLKKLLDDATRQALLKQALTTASDSVIPFSLGLAPPMKMDQATSSSSSFVNNKGAEMEQILSDLQALTRLYSLLHTGPADENLDEASRALLMKILEDATQEAVRRQAKMLSGSLVSSPALERKLSVRSDCQTQAQHADPRPRPVASPRPSLLGLAREPSRRLNLQHSTVSHRSGLHVDGQRRAAEEPPLARLASKRSDCRTPHADPRLRPVASPRPSLLARERSRRLNLQHSTVSSRSGLHVDGRRHAAEEPPLARLASKRSDCRTPHADPRLRPVASPRPSLMARERSRRLNLQHSTVSSQSGLHVIDGHRHAAKEPPLARLASKRSSRTALPARHRPSQEQRQSSPSLRHFPAAGTSRHGTVVTGGTRLADRRDSIGRCSSGRGDQWSLERSNSSSRSSSSRRSVSSRSGLHVDGHRHAAEEPPLARLASKRSSRTALPARHRPSQEQLHSSLSLRRLPAAGTSRHGTVVTGGTRLADRRDSIGRRSSGRGDQWSLERSISSRSRSSSSSRRSVSRRELSLGPSSRLHGRATPRHRHVDAESSSSAHLFERLDSGLSVSTTSRHGVEHARCGAATPECSSSSNTVATIHSRIRPSNSLLVERRSLVLRSAAEEGRTWRARHASDVSSADMYISSVSSVSRSSSGAASLSASTRPTASPAPAPRAYATPYYYSPPVMAAPWGIAPPPVYAPAVSRSMRRRRRQEILEKRVARLRMLKEKIATVFHHLQDHHHHLGGRQEAGPSSRSVVVRGAGHLDSPWQYLTSMFHHAKEKVKNTTSRAVVGVPGKRRGGGGAAKNMHALFDAVRQHLKSKRRAPAPGIKGMKLRRKASRVVRAKKMHWWQQLKQRRGMAGLIGGSRPRRRLGHGMAGWL